MSEKGRPDREKVARVLVKLYWGTRTDKMPQWEDLDKVERRDILEEADKILIIIIDGLKKQIDIKRDYAFGESLFGSLEHQAQMSAMVGVYDLVLNLIKDIGGKE